MVNLYLKVVATMRTFFSSCVQEYEVFIPNLVFLGLTISEILSFLRTDRRTWLHRLGSSPWSRIYILMGSVRLPSMRYKLRGKIIIPSARV